MQEMMDFGLWFLQQLPDFLMTEPVSAFTGVAFLFCVVALVERIIKI